MSNFIKKSSLAILVFIIALPLSASAEPGDRKFSVGVSTVFSHFFSGDAGKETDAPGYDDLFKGGYGIALEAEYPLNKYASLIGGMGYEKFSGKNHQGFEFDDLKIMPLYVGGKLYISEKCPFKPYVLMNIGASHFSGVDVAWGSISDSYWNSSWVFMGDVGLGLSYAINNWAFFANVKCRYMGAPDNNLNTADAKGSWSLPVSLGVSYAF